ncbi:hypothetical protein TBLA_0H02820 [Henningerozyma blattae CBS 6284]|uniref:protein-tyrosine-phosphatase n=1 Tax=Henningerozyma blattae (strain ATCC 34711 / CBS 6284 / DSM 70876 / NBRC 10599 / NRRL Y-10934 / UCD 77-7) TaxID=1071380 RepID=I2H864_HENB6|nr:hypothetical protein TBLA_0H02820 [Tetrapisispora blattae CBS 6284]CCH62566.1 hypothetical protein TBLA_0H02820 [Tetrapisispora blattae CBS 6284]
MQDDMINKDSQLTSKTETNLQSSKLFDSQLKNLQIKFENNLNNDYDTFNRISSNTLFNLINDTKLWKNHYSDLKIIDCRFNYEFIGGHIENSININSIEHLKNFYFDSTRKCSKKPELLIFHCEFSQFRSLYLLKQLRRLDRFNCLDNYPLLNFPDLLILNEGYKDWFSYYPLKCSPQNYIPMVSNQNYELYLQDFSNCKLDLCTSKLDPPTHTNKQNTMEKRSLRKTNTAISFKSDFNEIRPTFRKSCSSKLFADELITKESHDPSLLLKRVLQDNF